MPGPKLLPKDHSPTHAIGGINHMPIPMPGSRLSWRLQLLLQRWRTVLLYCDQYRSGTYISTCSTCGVVYRRYSSNQVELCWFSYTATRCQSWVALSVSKLDTLLCGDNDLCFTYEVALSIVIFLLHASAQNLFSSARCSSSRVCECVCDGVYVSVSKLQTLSCSDVDFRSTHKVEDNDFPVTHKCS